MRIFVIIIIKLRLLYPKVIDMDLKKIVVSDYDKTFYLNAKDIENNKTAVNDFRKNGNIFVIATGRSYFDLQNKVKIYNFEYDYALINHGATIIDKNGNVIYNFPIKNQIINNLKNDLELDKTDKYFCCSELESRVDFNHTNLTKIALVYNDEVNVQNLSSKINKKYNEINSYPVIQNMLEIISKETDKSKSIKLLSKYIGLSNLSNIYTIGDGYSDISMVKNYNGYAMQNSVNELKNVANKEYKSVSEMISDILNNKI